MQINFDRKWSGEQLLTAFLRTFPNISPGSPGTRDYYWQVVGRPHEIEYEAVDSLVVRHDYRSWKASPQCKAITPHQTHDTWVKDPTWGDIKAISLAPVREDKMYTSATLIFEGVDNDSEARRTDEVKKKLDDVVQRFYTELLSGAQAQAA